MHRFPDYPAHLADEARFGGNDWSGGGTGCGAYDDDAYGAMNGNGDCEQEQESLPSLRYGWFLYERRNELTESGSGCAYEYGGMSLRADGTPNFTRYALLIPFSIAMYIRAKNLGVPEYILDLEIVEDPRLSRYKEP